MDISGWQKLAPKPSCRLTHLRMPRTDLDELSRRQFLEFAEWAFGPDGLPQLQALACGDFSRYTSNAKYLMLVCRNQQCGQIVTLATASTQREENMRPFTLWNACDPCSTGRSSKKSCKELQASIFDSAFGLDFGLRDFVHENMDMMTAYSLEVTVIVDNELDVMSPPPPGTVESTGLLGNIGMRSPLVHGRGEGTRELKMDSICCSAHGLSVLLTATKDGVKRSILFDTGPFEDVWEANVERLGVDISTVERILLSHWHRDHSGGMLRAIRLIKEAQQAKNDPSELVVDLHPARPDYRGFKMGPDIVSLEADPAFEEIESAGGKVEKHSAPHTVLDNMFLISGEVPRETPYETGLRNGMRFDKSSGQWEIDELISDERFLACNIKDRGLVLFTGCSHAGVVNTSRQAVKLIGEQVPVHAIFGGYHLANSEPSQVKATVQDLKALNPRMLLPGHCSGWRVKHEIENEMPGRLLLCFGYLVITIHRGTMHFKNQPGALTREFAQSLDHADPLKEFRDQFIIPTKKDLTRKTLVAPSEEEPSSPCIYFCGNSLGLQPKNSRKYIDRFLQSWATKGVMGHFTPHDDEYLPPYLHMDDKAAELMAPIVGASPSEVAIMNTLTANLHFLMASFYCPTKDKFKIILEGKAFPSDHFAIESQIRHHGFDPKEGMVLIEPRDPSIPLLTTEQILETIDQHASTTALILLPGIQYYTGQYFDIKRITAYAHSHGLLIGWDCAHAVGNVELKLHEWDVDFAAWCTYKYVNSGPGSMGGLFVNERHGIVDMSNTSEPFRPRLSGWWGGDKGIRFIMDTNFVPRPGAAGFQVSNPSALDMTPVLASLEIFNKATMAAIRKKSVDLTAFLENLLLNIDHHDKLFTILTPTDPTARGAQLSVRLQPGLLEHVFASLLANGVVLDERKPDVIRVAPAPLYNTYTDVWDFVQILRDACNDAKAKLEK
ncbi:Kynureninase (L-kynurenine hydrolase) [Myotisia sp. PD_48]|nr:Kynureninase (L-kynurenine hydrolase) [Myotisia sp. PD_48]